MLALCASNTQRKYLLKLGILITLFLMSGQVHASGLDNVINEVLNPPRGEIDIWFLGWFVIWLIGLLVSLPFFVGSYRGYRKKEGWFLKAFLGVIILVVVESVASVIYWGVLIMFALLN
jgi:hypothetical protein